jgi:hypothetical protein
MRLEFSSLDCDLWRSCACAEGVRSCRVAKRAPDSRHQGRARILHIQRSMGHMLSSPSQASRQSSLALHSKRKTAARPRRVLPCKWSRIQPPCPAQLSTFPHRPIIPFVLSDKPVLSQLPTPPSTAQTRICTLGPSTPVFLARSSEIRKPSML